MGTMIIVDSGSDLEAAEAARLRVEVVPVWILMGSDRMRDGIEIDRTTFFRRLEAGEFPKTEPPAQSDYAAIFRRALAAGDDAVCITMAPAISQSHANALAAAKGFGGHIHVVDSRGASGMQTLLVRYAAELAATGLPAAEIAQRIAPASFTNASFFPYRIFTRCSAADGCPKALPRSVRS